jgi:hypothetical protein
MLLRPLKTLMQLLKKLSGTNNNSATTSSLEKSGELVSFETTEDSGNPYGQHLCTVSADVFVKGVYVVVSKGERTFISKFVPHQEFLEYVKKVEQGK